jgi:hypothetical protein
MYICIYINTYRERDREESNYRVYVYRGERREERGKEDAQTCMCTHICAADPLILSRYPLPPSGRNSPRGGLLQIFEL